MFDQIDQLGVNTIRALSIDQINSANSGHPGMPMGAAPMAYTLWSRFLNVNFKSPKWVNRDRFVLSAGHASALQYSLLHLAGFDVTTEDLNQFRKIGSKTPGHPEYGHTEGVEATTGPLGQGFANAVGMAMAEAHLAAIYNQPGFPIIDHFTYVMCGDGDLMEGISYEASSLVGHLKLGKLIVLYDSNGISLDGPTKLAFTEEIQRRFESAGWHYLKVEAGDDLQRISDAIQQAKKDTERPSLIEIKTIIGVGSPNQGTNKVHGAPLGEEGSRIAKAFHGWAYPDFTVPEEVKERLDATLKTRGTKAEADWNLLFEEYKKAYPELAQQLLDGFARRLPDGWENGLPVHTTDSKPVATRKASSITIQKIAAEIPALWGGSADLSSSNNSMIDGGGNFQADNYAGRNIWFGVREFSMSAVMNGILYHGGTIPYVSTFFVFSDYFRPTIRVAAMSKIPAIYVMTHDSVAVGEDGPTHEPVEHLEASRAIPNLHVIRPADANEVSAAWKLAVESRETPTMLVLSRQNLPIVPGTHEMAMEGVSHGAYILSPAEKEEADGLLIATGSEVGLAINVQKLLKADGIDVSVVSMPCQEVFEAQSQEYQESVLPANIKNRMSIEMGVTRGWARYIGSDGISIGIDRYGASGDGNQITREYGFDEGVIAGTFKDTFYKNN